QPINHAQALRHGLERAERPGQSGHQPHDAHDGQSARIAVDSAQFAKRQLQRGPVHEIALRFAHRSLPSTQSWGEGHHARSLRVSNLNGDRITVDFSPLMTADLAIQIHATAAMLAFFLGTAVLLRRKGDRLHKAMGRIWIATMVVVALSSFLITEIRLWGPYSFIHLLSIFTLFGV